MKKLIIAALLLPLSALAQTFPSPTFNSITLQNPLTPANGGTGATSSTGTGSVVLSNSPTLVTPNLGTPSAVTLTHGAGLPISTGVSGLGTGVATALGAAVTGTGGMALATSPTFSGTVTTPNLSVTGATSLTNAPTMGAATIYPTVATNTALKALATTTASVVTRLGFSAVGDVPPLMYTASGSACSLNSGAGDNGGQVQSADGKCWLASFSSGDLDVREWGVVAAGAATDNTTALQAAWNYGASINRNILLPSSTTTNYVRISALTAPTPVSLNTGNRSALVGHGAGQTVLQSTVGNGSCAIALNATFGVNSAYNNTFRDFTLLGTNFAGNGICLTNVTHAIFSGLYIGTFQNGVFAQDTLDVTWIEDVWNGFANTAVNAAFVTNTHPNAWTFIDPHVFFAVNAGFLFQSPADLNILGGDWENNNIGGTAGASAIVIDGNPVDGTKGLNLSGGYFSINGGAADILISDVFPGGATNLNGVHTINGAEFDRVDMTQINTNNILINNTGTGTTTVNVRGNGFQGFGAYTPSSSRLYVAETTPSATNYVINSGGNWFSSPVETPTGAFWQETGWTPYTPSLSCLSGSLTTASATGLWKRLTLKTIAVQVNINVTTLGTCSTTLNFSLPSAANSSEIGMLRNTAVNTSGSITTSAGSSTAQMLSATGGLPAASGNSVIGTVVYEAQ